MDKVTRQCSQTTTFLTRKKSRSSIEPRSFRLPAYCLTARPNRLTGVFKGLEGNIGYKLVSDFFFSPSTPHTPPFLGAGGGGLLNADPDRHAAREKWTR